MHYQIYYYILLYITVLLLLAERHTCEVHERVRVCLPMIHRPETLPTHYGATERAHSPDLSTRARKELGVPP
jgi:hypothetical protein